MKEQRNLNEAIDQKRNEMITIAASTGLSSDNTLRCSQELDRLIIKYQQTWSRKSAVNYCG